MEEMDLNLTQRRAVAESAVHAGVLATRQGSVDAMKESIQAAFPNEAIVSASDDLSRASLESRILHCWLIDEGSAWVGPAVTWVVDGEPLASVVYLPASGELLVAVRGRGIRISQRPAYIQDTAIDPLILWQSGIQAPLEQLLRRMRGWKIPSSSASPLISACYLASGRIDACSVSAQAIAPWAIAPAVLMVVEARGVIESADLMATSFQAAANAGLLHALRQGATVNSDSGALPAVVARSGRENRQA